MATKITSGSIFSAGAVVTGVDADAPPAVPSPSPEPAPAPATAQILPLSRAVSLLMDASATADGSVVDSSANSHSITTHGDVSQSSFSPYRSGGYSLYNTGTNHIEKTGLTAPGTGDFTIEAWVYVTNSSANQLIWDTRPISVDNTTGINVQFRSNNKLYAGSHNVGYITGATTFSDNEWVHVALVRSGGTLTLYGNGVSQGSVSHSVNLTSTDINIGSNRAGYSVFNGHISDLRVVNAAVYTDSFTPPTSRLTSIDDTVLLTCNLPYVQSDLTVTGDVSMAAKAPYDYAGYSESLHGGSYVFDGNGDYLQSSTHVSLAMGSSDFTVEGWVNTDNNANSTYPTWMSNWSGGWGANAWSLHTHHSAQPNKFTFYCYNYSAHGPLLESSLTVKENTWYHVSLTRSGSTFSLWVNGELEATATFTGAIDNGVEHGVFLPSPVAVNSWSGSISDFRIVKGTAVYTADFTPSTAPLTAVAGTSLLLSGNNASIRDESQSVESISVFGNTTVADSSPYGTGKSIEFDGSTGYIWSPDHSGVRFNTGDFTAECWFKLDAFPYDSPNRTQATGILGKRSSDFNSGAYWRIACHLDGTVSYQTSENGSSARLSSQNPVSLDTWYHIAVSRSAGTVTLYLNGVAQDSRACSDNLDYVGEQIVIGNLEGAYLLNGNVSDVRLVKGTAVYTENFTVPSAPLGDYTVAVESPAPAPEPVFAELSTTDVKSSYPPVITNDGLTVSASTSVDQWTHGRATMSFTSGKYYWEAIPNGNGMIGLELDTADGDRATFNNGIHVLAARDGKIWKDDVRVVSGQTDWTDGDVVGIAVDGDTGLVQFYINGVAGMSYNTGWGSDKVKLPAYGVYKYGSHDWSWTFNFGASGFAHTPPAGYQALSQ